MKSNLENTSVEELSTHWRECLVMVQNELSNTSSVIDSSDDLSESGSPTSTQVEHPLHVAEEEFHTSGG